MVKQNLRGKRFGKLTVVEEGPGYKEPKSGCRRPNWYCDCDCGKKHILVTASNLRGGQQSCGCITKENVSKANKKKNTYDLTGPFGKGYDAKGNEFLFDLDDYDKIKDYYWSRYNTGYFVASYRSNGEVFTIQLHRIILGIQNEDVTVIVGDHINGKDSRYDNRKSNLRIATRRQNVINVGVKKNNTSGVTGVYWSESKKRWIASINDRVGHHKYLGSFSSFDEAVVVRKKAEMEYADDYSFIPSFGGAT